MSIRNRAHAEPPNSTGSKLNLKTSNNNDSKDYSPHLNPVHISTSPSLLSRRITPGFALTTSEARNQRREKEGRNTSRPLDITGFKHLLMLVLVTGNIKMIWGDWAQFGFWTTLESFGLGKKDMKMAVLISIVDLLFMPLALFVERLAAWSALSIFISTQDKSRRISRNYVSILKIVSVLMSLSHFLLCILCIVGGSFLTWHYVKHPLIATGCEANVIVTFMKLVSFALTNNGLREARINKKPVPEFYAASPQYPDNLTLKNLIFYWIAPTLIYQPLYPQRSEVRLSRIPPLIGEIMTGTILIWVLMMQIGLPILEHLVNNFHSGQTFIEDYLTLATINITIWIIGFIVLFQSTLNLTAEVTKFADRNFYGDWWNAGSVGTFWRDWNRPISNFFRRHLYVPMRAAGFSRMIASNAVFLVSAILHELLFGVATHNFNGVAFLCMIVQPILILVTEPLEKSRGRGTTVGNCVFWTSILFGQPTAVVIYYLEWVSRNPQSKSLTSWSKELIAEWNK